MEINNPAVLAEVTSSFNRYQDAIIANDPEVAGHCMERHFDEARRALARARGRKEK